MNILVRLGGVMNVQKIYLVLPSLHVRTKDRTSAETTTLMPVQNAASLARVDYQVTAPTILLVLRLHLAIVMDLV